VARNDQSVTGFVFEDANRDGKFQQGNEPGIPGVMVSNGQHVVVTDAEGRYTLENIFSYGKNPTRPGAMTVFVTKPAGYDNPVDENNMPRFFYHHLPAGSPPGIDTDGNPKPLRYGGLPPSGPLPELINFPLVKSAKKTKFKVVVAGDPQTYSNAEVGYLRDTLGRELAAMDTSNLEAIIIEGDVLGDDLDLFPRYKRVLSVAKTPQYYVPGNHDLDFDAATDANSLDTFKREAGPAYYSFDIGEVHFIVFDDVEYPCFDLDGIHGGCDADQAPPYKKKRAYNGIISPRQMQWLKNDLALVPEHKLVVLNMHIAIHSYQDQDPAFAARQMVDNVVELYQTLGCQRAADGTFPPERCSRPLLAISGHTHTLEQIRPGESYRSWEETLSSGGVWESPGPAPFPQIVAGAACGAWWGGDLDSDGIGEAWQKQGAPRGYLIFEFDGNSYKDTFKATGKDAGEQISVDILTPDFVAWYEKLEAWRRSDPAPGDIPPVNINDLPDTKQILNDELDETLLSANVWNGSRDSSVFVQIDNRAPVAMTRTEIGDGRDGNPDDDQYGKVRALDPYALKRQMQIARWAYVSESENPNAQGYRQFNGARRRGTPRSDPSARTTSSIHLWRAPMPRDLALGIHVAKITTKDIHGNEYHAIISFEVVKQRPYPWWNKAKWED
jgi:hypothetical protein